MAAVLDQIDPRAAACWWARRKRIAFVEGVRGGCALGQGLREGRRRPRAERWGAGRETLAQGKEGGSGSRRPIVAFFGYHVER